MQNTLFCRQVFSFDLKRGFHVSTFMATRKSSARKIRLIKKTNQAKSVPSWVILKTKRAVRTNPKARQWRRTDVEVG